MQECDEYEETGDTEEITEWGAVGGRKYFKHWLRRPDGEKGVKVRAGESFNISISLGFDPRCQTYSTLFEKRPAIPNADFLIHPSLLDTNGTNPDSGQIPALYYSYW